MESREQRIASLATTLKASGIAKSEAQARIMAEDMIGVEEHVQKKYEVEHQRAHEFLSTAKNLGNPRPREQSSQNQSPLISPVNSTPQPSVSGYQARQAAMNQESSRPLFEEITVGKSSSHSSGNAALEAIKLAALEQSKTFQAVPNAQTENKISAPLPNALPESAKSTMDQGDKSNVGKSLDQLAHEAPNVGDFSQTTPSIAVAPLNQEKSSVISEITPEENVQTTNLSSSENVSLPPKDPEPVEPPLVSLPPKDFETSDSTPVDSSNSPKLDAQKLVEIMEEDGKMEEKTREIKEKPKDTKPKEAYAENSIDLAAIFGAKK